MCPFNICERIIVMKISTEINSSAKLVGEERAIELIAKAGFDAWDFSMFAMCKFDWESGKMLPNSHPLAGNDYLKFARRLRQVGLDNGIVCNQSHAPFPTSCDEVRAHFKRAIECTAEAGGEICVIHPDNNKSAEENAEIYFELLPFAKDCNVKIATENMWNWDKEKDEPCFAACATAQSFREHIDAVNDPAFVACLDIGHAEMRTLNTSAVEMIHTLGSDLGALHIHDNDRFGDSHQIPFSMDIDFVPIAKALKEIGYKGYFTLEADRYLESFDESNVFDGIVNLKKSVQRLADIYEQF